MTQLLNGNFLQTAEGFDSYEVFEAVPGLTFRVAQIVEESFGFWSEGLPIFGLDQIYIDLHRDTIVLTAGWDNWSGFVLYAHSEEGSAAVQEIGAYLNTILDTLG